MEAFKPFSDPHLSTEMMVPMRVAHALEHIAGQLEHIAGQIGEINTRLAGESSAAEAEKVKQIQQKLADETALRQAQFGKTQG